MTECFTQKTCQWIVISFASLLLLPLPGKAQLAADVLDRASDRTVTSYQPNERYKYTVLGSSYGREAVMQLPVTTQRITQIDLVYTAYSEDPNFDQRQLDIGRIEQLLATNPRLAANPLHSFRYVRQTGCTSTADCLDFFHGFVVYYDPYHTKEETQLEIDSIDQELTQLNNQLFQHKSLVQITKRAVPCAYPSLSTSSEYLAGRLKEFYSCTEKFTGKVFFNTQLDDKGRPVRVYIRGSRFPCQEVLRTILRRILRWKTGIRLGREKFPVTIHGSIAFPIRDNSFSFDRVEPPEELVEAFQIQQQSLGCEALKVDTSYVDIFPYVKKTEVSITLNRNGWADSLFIVDVTASMFPYTADLLRWVKVLADKRKKAFVFFNDGNDKPNKAKRLGNTGGIEWVSTSDYKVARNKMYEVMRKGGGGDTPENNIEALLYGQKKVPEATSAIMIADNQAFPRDAQLISRYTGDLKIILCGTRLGINTKYLNFAYLNDFSLHTQDTDLTGLASTKPGEVISIDGFRYQLTHQGFKKAYR